LITAKPGLIQKSIGELKKSPGKERHFCPMSGQMGIATELLLIQYHHQLQQRHPS
jgi:hypothetical protein